MKMRWIVKRSIILVLTVYVIITFTFFLIRLMPGNIVDVLVFQYLMEGVPEKEARLMVSALIGYNMSKPVLEQYFDYITNLLRGDLGYSLYYYRVPVISILSRAVPWTVFVLSIGITVSFAIGMVLGIIMAYRRGGIFDTIASFFATVISAVPNYIVGLLLLFTFTITVPVYTEGLLGGAYDLGLEPGFNWPFIVSVFKHATLPILTYIVTGMGSWMLRMRANTISVLGEDYVLAAEARGLKKRRIALSYVGRNAILPLFTRFTIALGYMFGGSVLIENIFTYPGMGYYLGFSVTSRDYTLMQGAFLLMTSAVVISNFIADFLYSRLDPRIKLE